MRAYGIFFCAVLFAAPAWGAAQAGGDAAAGRDKAMGCASCHGLDGKGRIPLAGKSADYLESRLRDFRSGARRDEAMNMIARQLDDQDIADLAAYFAAR